MTKIDIIDALTDYESLEVMPDSELCSYCYTTKLQMMQQSPYSAYDDLYAEMLSIVNKRTCPFCVPEIPCRMLTTQLV